MQKFKKLALSLTVLSIVLAFGASSQVSAIRDPSTVKSEDIQTAQSDDSSQKGDHSELRKKAAAELAAMRAKHQGAKTQSAAERQKRCEGRKHGLNTKFNNIAINSQKIQDRIDGIFAKAQAYKQAKNLQPENYDNLVAAATSAQATSQASITALKSLTPTIDCTGTNAASDVAAYKTAAADARDKLKAYRTAVKDVIKALIDTKKSTTEGSNQ